MKKNIKKWLAGILAAVCLAGTLAGCGGQGTGAVSSETDASASVVSASDSTSAEAGKYPSVSYTHLEQADRTAGSEMRKMEHAMYFAYGSNMNLDQMAYWCPAAEAVCKMCIRDSYLVEYV